jgi:hypothetical protein
MADEYVRICRSIPPHPPYSRNIPLTCFFSLQDPVEAAEIKKKRTFRKFSYRGIDLDQYASSSSSHPPTPPE